jgi:hypothetical protein
MANPDQGQPMEQDGALEQDLDRLMSEIEQLGDELNAQTPPVEELLRASASAEPPADTPAEQVPEPSPPGELESPEPPSPVAETAETAEPPADDQAPSTPDTAPADPDPVADANADANTVVEPDAEGAAVTGREGEAQTPRPPDATEAPEPAIAGEEPASTGTDGTEIPIDPEDEFVAEEEISQALGQTGRNRQRSRGTTGKSITADCVLPAPMRMVVGIFTAVDYAFRWMPPTIKDFLGYLGISMLILGAILWIVVLLR